MTLVMALLMMVVLTSVSTTTIYYVTSNVHSTGISKASTSAYDVAEAGLNDSVAKMYNQLDTDGSVLTGGIDPRSATMFPSCAGTTPPAPTPISYTNVGGTALICGDYNPVVNATTITVAGVVTPLAGFTWRIQSIGRVSSAGKMQSRTLTKSLEVVGLNDGANGSTWSRFYQDSTASCLTINNSTFVTNVATRGDLCLKGGGEITGANTVVDVGGDVSIIGNNSTSGPRGASTENATWTSPANIATSNNNDATNTVAANTTGSNLDATGFGFAIPTTAMIAGIKVSVERGSNPGANAVQSISVTGSPSGGTFKLTGTPPGGSARTTVSINRNAAASGTGSPVSVQAALESIYGVGNVTCSGGPLMSAAVSCTFAGSYASMPVTLMSMSTNALTGGSSPKAVITSTTNGYTPAFQDSTVQLLKAGVIPGGETNEASAAIWGLPDTAIPYGGTSDLWGTTWTPADVNATNFGLRFATKNTGGTSSTATVDYISITVTYIPAAPGIGTSTTSTKQLNVGGSCTYLNQAADTPCTAADHTYATTVTTTSAANNPALVMPDVDFDYWWANAMPGPKHFCTNPSPGLSTSFFDNNASTTSGPDRSLNVNGEMAPATSDYTCQVWSIPPTGGQLLGELSWNHTTHILKISGTIFVDGNFRFDEDGEVIHYLGRATLMSSRDDEIDALVCAGGSGTGYPACLSDMTNWNPSANIMVLMSQENNEYDQGGTNCSGNTHPGCWNGHPPAGFQGIMFSTADCLIHQEFQDSGPVICNTITLPDESGLNPTFFVFPSIGNLTDGQKYSDTTTATNFELDPGAQTGG